MSLTNFRTPVVISRGPNRGLQGFMAGDFEHWKSKLGENGNLLVYFPGREYPHRLKRIRIDRLKADEQGRML